MECTSLFRLDGGHDESLGRSLCKAAIVLAVLRKDECKMRICGHSSHSANQIKQQELGIPIMRDKEEHVEIIYRSQPDHEFQPPRCPASPSHSECCIANEGRPLRLTASCW